jgi:hypothetical protein
LLKNKGQLDPDNIRICENYLNILERNEQDIYDRLYDLTDPHIDRIEGIDPDEMDPEDRIKTVHEYFCQATDKDNPMRQAFSIDEDMKGRMMGTLQSYDFMDNEKYTKLDRLFSIMQETFGYSKDIHGLVKTSITEANLILLKKSADLQKLLQGDNHMEDSI